MPRWLLLAHQLPTRPSGVRVKTWRRLQEVGAIQARNSVYVLPNGETPRVAFERVRGEIVSLGGEATVFAADVTSPEGDDSIVQLFRRARREDYAEIIQDASRLLRQTSRKRQAPVTRGLAALQQRLEEIQTIDFFDADGRHDAADSVARLRVRATRTGDGIPAVEPRPLDPAAFQRRRWVSRPRPGIDRLASAWLIRRFIDPAATFAFDARPRASDVPFDMRDVEFGHQGDWCTFETLAHQFGLDDPAVVRLGRIVHDLDLHDGRFGLPETAAVGQVVDRLRQLPVDDHALLEQGVAVFEALARSFAASQLLAVTMQTRRARQSRR
jgi:hypothetical protein